MGAQAARDNGRGAEPIGHGDRHLRDRGVHGERGDEGVRVELAGDGVGEYGGPVVDCVWGRTKESRGCWRKRR